MYSSGDIYIEITISGTVMVEMVGNLVAAYGVPQKIVKVATVKLAISISPTYVIFLSRETRNRLKKRKKLNFTLGRPYCKNTEIILSCVQEGGGIY